MRFTKLFYGWWVLIGCAAIQLYYNATFVNGFTALFNPIADEFHWNYTQVSIAMTFRNAENGLLSPVVGFFVDKWRPRKILFIGAITGSIGFFLFSRIESIWGFYATFIMLGISLSMTSQIVIISAVAPWFKKKLNTAIGILTGAAATGALLVPAVVWFVDLTTWRHAVEYFALGSLAICIPLCFLVKDPPPENMTENNKSVLQKPVERINIKRIVKNKNFWLLGTAVLFSYMAYAALMAHQIPYLLSIGISRETAGWVTLIFAVGNILGRVSFGGLGDLMKNNKICWVLACGCQLAGLVGFSFSTTIMPIYISLFVIGLGMGGIMPLRISLQTDFFGMNAFAVTQGLILIFFTVSTMVGPVFAGWIYDMSHSYHIAWIVFMIATAISIPVIMMTKKPSSIDLLDTVQKTQ